MATQGEIIRHNVAETVRVAREGGQGWLLLPGSRPGTVCGGRIGQEDAEELFAWLTDRLMADIAARDRRGEALTGGETEALRLWRENVPHAYVWVTTDGCNVLIPENAAGRLLPWEYPLAAHPSELAEAVGWLAPKNSKRGGFSGFLRLDVPTGGRRYHVATLRFPPGAGLLTAWAVFERLNAERAMERLSPQDRLRHLSVYGTRVRDGREEAFNRLYEKVYERPAVAADISQRWFYTDEHSEAEKQRRAEEAAAMLGIGRLEKRGRLAPTRHRPHNTHGRV